jgi:bile acid:Na+ symporter, BASS family
VTGDNSTRTSDRLAHFVRRHFFWLLLGSFALAGIWSAPGVAMRHWEWSSGNVTRVPLSLPLLLLAVMLFSAAVLTDLSQIRLVSRHPVVLLVALLAVWIGPGLLVLAAGWLMPATVDGQSTAGLVIGLALVATMPVANSSVGWTQNADGNLGLGLSLVVLSILLCPWVTPNLLHLWGMSLSPAEQALSAALVNTFSGWFFIIWVLLPTAAGIACRYLAGPNRVAEWASVFVVASAAALLLLNYINAALAVPRIYEASWALLATTAALAASLSVVGHVLGWAIAWVSRVKPATRDALMFGLSMKHTGLALLLAGAVLADQPLAILIVVLSTLLQHILAGIVQHWLSRSAAP